MKRSSALARTTLHHRRAQPPHTGMVEGLQPIEPKLYFANERTFLHCAPPRRRAAPTPHRLRSISRASSAGMHACVSLASVAMVVTAAGDRGSPGWLLCGTILSLLAIFMMFEPTLRSFRDLQIRTNEMLIHNQTNTHLLTYNIALLC